MNGGQCTNYKRRLCKHVFYLSGRLSLQFSLLLILGGRNDAAIKAVRVYEFIK